MLAFAAVIILPLFSPLARTITVDDDGPADYSVIERALDSATAEDTVFVKAGTYYECGIALFRASGAALLKGEGVNVTKILGRMGQFLSRDWSGLESPYSFASSFPAQDSSMQGWRNHTFIIWELSPASTAIEGLTLGWEGEERGVGIIAMSSDVTMRRCKLTGNYVGLWLETSLEWPHRQIIEANMITGNEYGVVWERGSDLGPEPGNIERNWWGTVEESEIKAGFLNTILQYWPNFANWIDDKEWFRLVCYPWLEAPVDVDNFEDRNEEGIHYNNICDNEVNFVTPRKLFDTAVEATTWGQIKSKMQ